MSKEAQLSPHDKEERVFALCVAKQDEVTAAEARVQGLRVEMEALHDELQAVQEANKGLPRVVFFGKEA